MRDALNSRALVLDTVAGPEIKSAYREAYRWYARCEARDSRIGAVVSALRLLLVYAMLVALFWLVGVRSSKLLETSLFYVGGWIAGSLLLAILWSFIERLPPKGRLSWAVSATSCTVGGIYLLWRQAGSAEALLHTIAANGWWTAITGAAVVPITILAVVLPSYLVVAWFLEQRAARTQPQVALRSHLFQLVLLLSDARVLNDHREWLLTKLNDAATVLEGGFWREIHLLDPVSRATWRDRCRQCARHLRSFDLWIVLPRDDTREVLLAEITGLIQVLVSGNLDDLPTAAPRSRRKLDVVSDAVTTVLLGAIPLAGVLAVDRFIGLNLSGPVGGALVVGATAWFALTVLITFDGQATTRLSHLKNLGDAMASLRGTSKP